MGPREITLVIIRLTAMTPTCHWSVFTDLPLLSLLLNLSYKNYICICLSPLSESVEISRTEALKLPSHWHQQHVKYIAFIDNGNAFVPINSWMNFYRRLNRNILPQDIAMIFEVSQREVYNMRMLWYETNWHDARNRFWFLLFGLVC